MMSAARIAPAGIGASQTRFGNRRGQGKHHEKRRHAHIWPRWLRHVKIAGSQSMICAIRRYLRTHHGAVTRSLVAASPRKPRVRAKRVIVMQITASSQSRADNFEGPYVDSRHGFEVAITRHGRRTPHIALASCSDESTPSCGGEDAAGS
jgi:hypothetical protein